MIPYKHPQEKEMILRYVKLLDDSLAETIQMKDREKARIGHGHLSYLMNRDVPQLVQPRLSGMESTCEKPRSMLDNYHIDRRLTTGSMTRSMLGS